MSIVSDAQNASFPKRREPKMSRFLVAVAVMALSMSSVTQEGTPKPTVSSDSLTPDQVAVYRAVLRDYTKGSDGALNLANRTEPVDESRPMFDEACFKEIEVGMPKPLATVSHTIEASLVVNTRIVLIDPDRQQKLIDKNDPQNLIKKAVDEHEKVTDEQVDQSVKHAFEVGMFTLSEIVFDKQHRRAVVAYSFVCGMLCGNGNTLILTKSGRDWKVTKRCGGWVS